MSDLEYENVIKDMCAQMGIDAWRQVVQTRHIEIGNRIIGLMHDEALGTDSALLVYIDMGNVIEEKSRDIYRQMLIANLESHSGQNGCFGIHPNTGNAVYHARVALPVTGSELTEQIALLLGRVERRFEELNS